jgi:dihydroorotase
VVWDVHYPDVSEANCSKRGDPDIAVLELREGSFEFLDNYQGKRTGKQRLFPVATVVGGKKAPPRA